MKGYECPRSKTTVLMVTWATVTMVLSYSYFSKSCFQHHIPAIVTPSHNIRDDGPLKNGPTQSYPCPTLSGFSKLTICPGDVIPEVNALSFPPCADENLAADAGKSVISLYGDRSRFKQGEMISIMVTLHDGNGRRKSVGGDHLRARIVGHGGTAAVTGTVFDHDNGSYTAQFEALIPGKMTIDVVVAHTRETITMMYRVRTKIMAIRPKRAEFINEDTLEETNCHTIPDWLSNYTELCNFTHVNSGMPWYCGKPANRNLLCEDWASMKYGQAFPQPVTTAERKLLKRLMRQIPNSITVTVDALTPNALTSRNQLIPCKEYNRTDLWYKRKPTGYIHKGQWNLRHCQAKFKPMFKTCVQNKNFLIFGDSTTRHWFQDFQNRLGCTLTSEPWANPSWPKRAKCTNINLRFTVEWLPHSQPIILGSLHHFAKYTTHSIARHLDEDIKDDDHAIVLIHMFMHVLANRHDVFQTKIRLIRQSVEKLLVRNKFATVLIKAPHTYDNDDDYFGYLYRNIMFHEFAGLHDKVVYLDHKDITNALQIASNHPPKNVVSAMVDQMLSYIC